MWSDSEIIQLQRQLAQHVHLSRLPSPESITVTPRELERARQSRHVLYVESQQLLQQYRDLMEDRFDRASVQELLRETFIQPADRPTLFELFCTFRILHQLELHAEGLTLQPMSSSGSGNVLAELSDERRSIRVAHDSTGTMEFEALFPQMSDLESHEGFEGIRQYRRAKDAYAAEMFGVHPATALFSGRPDVLIEVRDRQRSGNPLQTIIIGEVKYTTRTQTLQNGLRELLEYMHFVQESGYLYPDQEQVTVRGILCSDGVETISEHVEDVIHLTTSDLNEKSETGRLSALVSVSYS
jgi:hypothetical protein